MLKNARVRVRVRVSGLGVSTFPVLLGLVCPAGWLDVCLSVCLNQGKVVQGVVRSCWDFDSVTGTHRVCMPKLFSPVWRNFFFGHNRGDPYETKNDQNFSWPNIITNCFQSVFCMPIDTLGGVGKCAPIILDKIWTFHWEMSFQKRSFWNWGNEMNKVDVVLGFVGAFEHLRRILVKFWRVSTFPVLLGLVCPGVCLSVRLS